MFIQAQIGRASSSTDALYTCLLTGSGVLLVDQFTKFIADQYHLVTLNKGISFGLLEIGHPILGGALLIGLGVIVVLILQKYWRQHPVSTGLFVGGALSNIADRISRGGVRDWLPLGPLPLKNNLADWAISLAALMIIITLYQNQTPKQHQI